MSMSKMSKMMVCIALFLFAPVLPVFCLSATEGTESVSTEAVLRRLATEDTEPTNTGTEPADTAPANDGLADLPRSAYPHFPSGKPEPGSGSAGSSDDPSECSVCIAEWEDGDELMRLPCGHVGLIATLIDQG